MLLLVSKPERKKLSFCPNSRSLSRLPFVDEINCKDNEFNCMIAARRRNQLQGRRIQLQGTLEIGPLFLNISSYDRSSNEASKIASLGAFTFDMHLTTIQPCKSLTNHEVFDIYAYKIRGTYGMQFVMKTSNNIGCMIQEFDPGTPSNPLLSQPQQQMSLDMDVMVDFSKYKNEDGMDGNLTSRGINIICNTENDLNTFDHLKIKRSLLSATVGS
ncbi:hypothetical protein RF11_12320 [Thelohanellus kitauei]|uniref:Uncharacterized protein n=1 Tax=Thelohanellus kitauei TaxID=669202 RepID=A0A0C2MUE0_THEKT|nr:hypothetical protein RF11_12320 [Thelohanellus kitauei]